MARIQPPVRERNTRFLVLATSCVAIAAMYFLRDVLIPVALSILVTFLLTPVVSQLEKWKLGRVVSVLVVVILLCGAIVGIGWVTAGQVLHLGEMLPQYQDDIVAKLRELKPGEGGTIEKISRTAQQVEEKLSRPATSPAGTTQPSDVIAQQIASNTNTPQVRTEKSVRDATRSGTGPTTQWTRENPLPVGVVEPALSPLDTVGNYLGVILGPLGTGGLVIVFVLFMLLQREDLRDRLIRLLGHGQMHLTTTALDDASTRISRYLLAQSIVNGSYGVAISLGLWIIGWVFGHPDRGDPSIFPSFVLWGLLCALLRFIPYIGPWIAAAFPMLVAFAVYKGFGVFIGVVTLFVVIELFSNNLMEPWLYGSSTGMSAVAILVSAVFWTFLWGPVGLLLSTPLTVCLVVLGKYVPQLEFLDIMLGDEPVFEPHQRIYQRLLALDEEEASDIALDYLDEMSLEQAYETILIPALGLSEQDRHRGLLDEERQVFIRRVMRRMIEELADRQRENDEKDAADRIKRDTDKVVAEARGQGVDLPVPQPQPPEHPVRKSAADTGSGLHHAATIGSGIVAKIAAVGSALGSGMMSKAAERTSHDRRSNIPKGCVISVVCLPAHDEADEIVGLMVAQLLEREGYCAYPVSVTALASEMLDKIAQTDAQIVCVSAIPPAAVTHSRYLCKRVHARFPKIKMVVGLWAYKGDLARAKQRITCESSVSIQPTLAEAMNELNQLAQPIVVRDEYDSDNAEKKG